MVDFFSNLATAFVLGVLTPLSAVCVLPLYPGFLASLSKKLSGDRDNKKVLVLFGVVISLGVITFMFLLGLIFTTILEASLTRVIGIISPLAFGILSIISLFLIFDIEIGKYLPKVNRPLSKNPLASAYIYGFFFGAIVIPCNPLFIAALFTVTIASMNFLLNILTFLSFGIGISFPLLLFSIFSATKSKEIINFLADKSRGINLVAGSIMLIISIYYLVFVFKVFG